MKNIDAKKLIVISIFILVILIVIGVGIFGKNGLGGNKTTEEQIKEAETNTLQYFASLKNGYATDYNGSELLYTEDKISFTDLNDSEILNTAIKYAVDYLDVAVDGSATEELALQGFTIDKFSMYNGSAIREAIKILFGIEWTNKSSTNELNFRYNFIYNEDYDVYLKGINSTVKDQSTTTPYSMSYRVVSSKKAKTNVEILMAVAYVTEDGNTLRYYASKDAEESVYEDNLESTSIKESEVNHFPTYKVILKNVENHLVFTSIEKE